MEKLNIAEILKYSDRGDRLYSPLCGECILMGVNTFNGKMSIRVATKNHGRYEFNEFGQYYDIANSECLLFPSKENRDWSTFQRPFKDGDIVATLSGAQIFIFKENAVNEDGGFSGVCYFGYQIQENKLFKERTWCFSRHATEEEKQKLFDAIKANGYKWNPETKTLEKKKKEYPTTYEECCEVLSLTPYYNVAYAYYRGEELDALYQLLVCRDAYWKIAGEEMGLGKPWKPDYTNPNEKRFAIHSYVVRGEDGVYRLIPVYSKIGEMRDALGERHILEFPTEEMRDAFYENFKDLINECKEFL